MTEKISELPADVGITDGFSLHLWKGAVDPVNFERAFMRWVGNVLEFGVEKGGTGVLRQVRMRSDNGALRLDTNSNLLLENTGGAILMRIDPTFSTISLQGNRPDRLKVFGAANFKLEIGDSSNGIVTGSIENQGDVASGQMTFKGTDGYAVGAGRAGGLATLAGGDAKGTGNNNGGDAIMQGGLPTGTGTPGRSKIDYACPKTPTTVAGLRSAAAAGVGAYGFVTDALAPVAHDPVTGGGAVARPVYSDGTTWRSF